MGWPKKHDEYRIYYERKSKTYLLVYVDGLDTHNCVGEILINNDPDNPRLAHMECSEYYIRKNWLKRVQWSDLPTVWQDAFKRVHFDIDPIERPEAIIGLWKVGNMPI